MAKSKVKNEFPKTLYIYKEKDGENVYFLANANVDDCVGICDNGQLIASYELRGVQRYEVTTKLVSVK